MQLGEYELTVPLGSGPAGAIFRAAAADGVEWEVRLLDRAREEPKSWSTLQRRFRLLSLLDHPCSLKPTALVLADERPYLVLPPRQRLPARVTLARAMAWAERLASLLAAAHRIGLTQGALHAEHLRLDGTGQIALDMTGTSPDTTAVTAVTAREAGPAGDVARLGAFLAELAPDMEATETVLATWRSLVEQMQAAKSDERPLARELVERIHAADLARLRSEPGGAADLAMTIDSGPPPPLRPDGEIRQIGECLGRFRLVEKLGEGGMGAVFRAEDLADGSMVALKVLHASRAGAAAGRRRFLKEARMLAELETAFVTRFIEANSDGDCLFLALEYVPGSSLGDSLRSKGKLDEATALSLISDAARGLAAAHDRGIVHRDVKPDNILLVGEVSGSTLPHVPGAPRAKMTDFGLARPVDQTESLEVTQAGAVLGTPLYMAPEQFDSRPLDARADVYALGATLFHMLAGRPPFQADSFQGIMAKHAREAPPALERLEPNVSLATAALVARSLAKDPAARPLDAGAFLRQVERIARGEAVTLQAHPRLPANAGQVMEYVYTWNLSASPHQLWPYVSNTERLNRAAGLPAIQYAFRLDPQLGNRRFATARVAGMQMEWEEHPFEWIEGQRFGVLREFSKGPFVWFMSIVDLQAKPEGGTTLKQTLRVEPRGWLGKLAARFELGVKTRGSLGRVYERIDATLENRSRSSPGDDPFELPSPLIASRQRRLQSAQEKLLAGGAAAAAVDLLGLYLAHASAQELARVRPVAIAQRFGLDRDEFVETCLRAVGEGLLTLKWDIICPLCRIPSERKDTLRELRDHEHCQACNAAFPADFASGVEMVFQVHPDIRQPELAMYCAGGPAHSPHVVAQTRVGSGEAIELELALTEGQYRLRGPCLPWAAELRIVASGAVRQADVDLGTADRPGAITLAAGGQILTLRNDRPHELLVRVERTAARDDALTAAQATALPAFRTLFPGELLSPGQLARAASVTLLLTQLDEGDSIYTRLGEGKAFSILQSSFRIQEEVIRSRGGALVKTFAEGVYAVFPEIAGAVEAALGLGAALAAEPETAALRLKTAVHRGLAMVATINDRLDYFGTTVKQAGCLLENCGGNELILTAASASDAEVNELLRGRTIRVAEVPRHEGGKHLAFRVTLPMKTAEPGI